MHEALETARVAALAGGTVLHARHGDTGAVRRKESPTDFVTEADIASGIAVVEEILRRHPTARVVVEEPEVYAKLGIEPGFTDDAEVWIIDPIDGTTSFLHGYPAYSVSVGLVRDGQPVVGAIYNAAMSELFSAQAAAGAWLDGADIRCSMAGSVQEALLVTGFPYDRGEPLDRQLAVLGAFLRAPVHGIRRDGTAALDCCHVAAGRADGFWEYTLKPWDMAAGVVIARESGAAITDCDGNPWTIASDSICVANPALQPKLLEVINSA